MKIPNKIKIGGKTYTVEITNKLDHGNKKYSGEIDYLDLVIRICPSAKDKMETDFLHELLHAVHDFMGINPQEEETIDRLANTLHMVIKDNPDVFGEVTDEEPIRQFDQSAFVYLPSPAFNAEEKRIGLLVNDGEGDIKLYFGKERGFRKIDKEVMWNLAAIEHKLRDDLEQEEVK